VSLDTRQLDPPDTREPSAYAPPTMDQLLAARTALRDHEEQLSYWRRVVQGRLDLLDARLAGGGPPSLPQVLGGDHQVTTRNAHAALRHVAPMPEIATAERAWALASGSEDTAVVAHAAARLRVAERWLSDQRSHVLAELDAATAALLHRLQEDPAAYLRSRGTRWIASAG
jgi:hypothetical protein